MEAEIQTFSHHNTRMTNYDPSAHVEQGDSPSDHVAAFNDETGMLDEIVQKSLLVVEMK